VALVLATRAGLLAPDARRERGRREVNFSEWGKYNQRQAARELKEMCEQVEHNEMPLWLYLPLHPTAKLTDADRKTPCDRAKQESARLSAA
jgi:hypothetical protein